MARAYISSRTKLFLALGASSLASVALYLIEAWNSHSFAFSYLPWNLILAWTPLLATLWLEYTLKRNLWSSWYALFVTIAWLMLLPNTFYMLSDFVHIQGIGQANLLYDVVVFSSFILNGVILGFFSLFLIHYELLKRITAQLASILIGVVIFLSSFAIYIGRDLRWDTWDVVVNPFSVLFDLSDRLLNPGQYSQVASTTLSFFVLISSIYIVIWFASKVARQQRQ